MLRLALASATMIEGAERFPWVVRTPLDVHEVALGIVTVAWILGGVFIIVGFLTRSVLTVVAIVEAALATMRVWGVPILEAVSHEAIVHVLEAASAMSLALTGPGAYSADARLFGRREILIRPPARAE